MEKPLVSVPVITYNSSNFVLETLESVKAQTYQNIELIISDDCSTDNTVELCQYWVEENQERFVRTQIITSETNTGVSANLNRAEAACQGEWVKGIAGDDLLMPNCIADCVEYIQQHLNVIYLFGRIEAFGASEEQNRHFAENVFDYSFFDLDIDGQLDRLVFGQNCVPASTCFYNRQKAIELGIRNDERIPLLEDWPKWINILEKGVKLEFMDKVVVRYRIHEGALSTKGVLSSRYVHSNLLFDLLYRYPKWMEVDSKSASMRYAEYYANIYSNVYNEYMRIQKKLSTIQSSHVYRIGSVLLKTIKKIKKWLSK